MGFRSPPLFSSHCTGATYLLASENSALFSEHLVGSRSVGGRHGGLRPSSGLAALFRRPDVGAAEQDSADAARPDVTAVLLSARRRPARGAHPTTYRCWRALPPPLVAQQSATADARNAPRRTPGSAAAPSARCRSRPRSPWRHTSAAWPALPPATTGGTPSTSPPVG